jgi:hypothetical protein
MPAPDPEPERLAPFTSPRRAPIAVQTSPKSDSEGGESYLDHNVDDKDYVNNDYSVFSQSSSKTPRKKLQPKWRFLSVKHKS